MKDRLTIKTENGFITNDTKCMKNKYIDKLGQLEDIEEELGIDLKSASELLKWFIDNTMLASELMEFKKASTHNKMFKGWSHNGYSIQDDKFETMLDLARAIKYKNGIRH